MAVNLLPPKSFVFLVGSKKIVFMVIQVSQREAA